MKRLEAFQKLPLDEMVKIFPCPKMVSELCIFKNCENCKMEWLLEEIDINEI